MRILLFSVIVSIATLSLVALLRDSSFCVQIAPQSFQLEVHCNSSKALSLLP